MTQNEKVLRYLKENHGQWVAMPAVASEVGCFAVHSRIADLRRLGFSIECKQEGRNPRRSYYRLTTPVQLDLPT